MADPPSTQEEFNAGECTPVSGCGCIGHVFPNVHHMVACCDVPHITEEEFWAPYGREEDERTNRE